MRKCLQCAATYDVTLIHCPVCNWAPVGQDGLFIYAPSLNKQEIGFKEEYFSELSILEDGNFWFKARNKIIINTLSRIENGLANFLEIGCGTGFVLHEIANALPQVQLFGSEIFVNGIFVAKKRVPTANFMQFDARSIPYQNEFDAIGLFDVLEHISEDDEVLREINLALKTHGYLILTVPQHDWLWSSVDDDACHVRRYSAKDLENKLRNAGFEIKLTTSFVFFLLPIMWLARKVKRHKPEKFAELKLNRVLNWFFYKIMVLEYFFIKNGVSFPVGGSRLVLARKI